MYIINAIGKFIFVVTKHFLRRGKGIFRFLLWIDDFIRLFAMTLFFSVISKLLNFGGFLTALVVILGIYVDIHDFLSDHKIGKFDFK